MEKRIKRKILKTYVDVITMDKSIEVIINWAKNREAKYISIMNINDLVNSWIDLKYRKITRTADLSLPDGAPLAFILRIYGFSKQKRVTGPDLMEKLIPILAKLNLTILFYGSTSRVLKKISQKIEKYFPNSSFHFMSPPFRELTNEEELGMTKEIASINPHIIFVGLGCPKQDLWIFEKKKFINSIFIGIGAAFDFYANTLKRAPIFMQENGLEWLFRLYKDPRRLFYRYLKNIFLFTIGIFIELLTSIIQTVQKYIKKYNI